MPDEKLPRKLLVTILGYLAGTSVLIAVGSLVALVFVASRSSADSLATTALALAVIAFIGQIVIFVAQLIVGNQQLARSEDISHQITGLLHELRGTTIGTQQTVDRYFGTLLDTIIQVATKVAVREAATAVEEHGQGRLPSPKINEAEVQERVTEAVRQAASARGVDLDSWAAWTELRRGTGTQLSVPEGSGTKDNVGGS